MTKLQQPADSELDQIETGRPGLSENDKNSLLSYFMLGAVAP
jgi:hypothetical protein